MIADGTFPPTAHPGETTTAPRVGDGLIRLDAAGTVTYASPNALSAYRRLGMSAGLEGEDLALLTKRLADDTLEGSRGQRAHPDGAAGREPAAQGDRRPGCLGAHAGAAADAGGGADRRAGAGPGHHRGAAPRPGVDHEGRHDPGDPPPGEEQPADGCRAAPAASAPGRHPGGSGRVGGICPPGRVDRAGARDAVDVVRRGRSSSTASSTGWRQRPERSRRTSPRSRCAARARSGCCRPRSRRRWSWCSTNCCSTRPNTRSRRARTARSPFPSRGSGGTSTSPSPTTAAVCPDDFDTEGSGKLGMQIVRTLVTGELRGTIEIRPGSLTGTEARVVFPLDKQVAAVDPTRRPDHARWVGSPLRCLAVC